MPSLNVISISLYYTQQNDVQVVKLVPNKYVSENIYKAQENNLSQFAVFKQPRQTGTISVCG